MQSTSYFPFLLSLTGKFLQQLRVKLWNKAKYFRINKEETMHKICSIFRKK